jgi:hypothetical protein
MEAHRLIEPGECRIPEREVSIEAIGDVGEHETGIASDLPQAHEHQDRAQMRHAQGNEREPDGCHCPADRQQYEPQPRVRAHGRVAQQRPDERLEGDDAHGQEGEPGDEALSWHVGPKRVANFDAA